MKKILFGFAFILSLTSCTKKDVVVDSVVSEQTSIKFKELMLLINIKPNDSTYLIVKSVDSVNIYINNYYWAKVGSYSLDTTKIKKYLNGNMFLSDKKQNYLINACQDVVSQDLTNAGDYAKYLNSGLDLEPGEYACFIESFQVTFKDNTTTKYYPQLYKNFKLENNNRSVFVGEIELKLN